MRSRNKGQEMVLKSSTPIRMCALICTMFLNAVGVCLYADGYSGFSAYMYNRPNDCWYVPGEDGKYYVGWAEDGVKYWFESPEPYVSCQIAHEDHYRSSDVYVKSQLTFRYGGKTYTIKNPVFGRLIKWNLWDGTIDGYQENYFREYGQYQRIFSSSHYTKIEEGCPPTKITFDDGVQYICKGAFANATAVYEVRLPIGLKTIEEATFSGCTLLKSINIPPALEVIGEKAFNGCSSLASVTLPSKVRSIGKAAFSGCSGLTSVTIPNSVTNIGQSAFSGCVGLANVTLPDSNKIIGPFAFSGCSGLTAVAIPDNSTEIGNDAFSCCTRLSRAKLPANIKIVPDRLFYSCDSLGEIELPDSVVEIGKGAFQCTALRTVAMPDSIISVGDYVFDGCTNLVNVQLSHSLTNLSAWMFAGCSNIREVTIPASVNRYGANAFAGVGDGFHVRFEEGTTNICYEMLRDCGALESVTIPDSVTSIGFSAFCKCTNLSSITLPKDLKHIGAYAFEYCSQLTQVTIPANVETIGLGAFSYTNIRQVDFLGKPPTEIEVDSHLPYAPFPRDAIGTYTAEHKAEWEAVIDANGYWKKTTDYGAYALKMKMRMKEEEKPTYTVVYHVSEGEGKEGAVENQTCEFGSNGVCADDGSALHWEWHFFMGWAFSEEGARAGNVDWRVREQICEPTDGNVVNCWDVWKKADFGIRFHGNGGRTAEGLDEVKMSFLSGNAQCLPDDCFTRGNNVFLGWQTGTAAEYNPDNSDKEYHKRRFYSVGTEDFNNFKPPENIDWTEFGDAITWENGVPILHLYAIWTSSLCVRFYDAQKSQNEKLAPAYLLEHIWWQFPKEKGKPWHKSGDEIEVPPGGQSIFCRIDSGYDQLVSFDDSCYTQIQDGEKIYLIGVAVESKADGLEPLSLTRTCFYDIKVLGGMSEWPSVRFKAKGEGGYDVPGLAPFVPEKVTARIWKKIDGQNSVPVGDFRVDSPIPLPAGSYSADFLYADGRQGWKMAESAVDFSLPFPDDIEVKFIPERDAPFYTVSDGNLMRVVANDSVSITLSGEVANVSATAFSGCEGLEEIVFEGDAPSVEDGTFAGLENCKILVPRGSVGWGVNIPGTWNGMRIEYFGEEPQPIFTIRNGVLTAVALNGATEVVIPDGVTDIMPQAFCNCSNLTSVVIPDGATHIWYRAFQGCSDLVSVTIPESLVCIDYNAFCECNDSLFDTMTIPGVKLVDGWAVGHTDSLSGHLDLTGIRGIGYSAFCECTGLTQVTIPDNVTNVADDAFFGCYGLRRVNLGRGVATIGQYAFSDCDMEVFIVPTGNAFYKVNAGLLLTKDGSTLVNGVNGNVMIPAGVASIGRNAFFGCRKLASVTIPNSVTNISDCAFQHCDRLTSVTMPGKVAWIGTMSFAYCNSIAEILIPVSVKGIGDSAFLGCKSLKKVALPQALRGAIDEGVFAGCHPDLEIVYYGEDDILINIKEMQVTGDDGAFTLDIGDQLVSASKPKVTVKGLPTGLKYDAKEMSISGKVTKPGVYKVTVSATNATVKKPVTAEFTITVPNFTTEMFEVAGLDTEGKYVLMAGVVPDGAAVSSNPPYLGLNAAIAAVAGEGWKLAVSGLPSGLKYDAKGNRITGVATKEGFYTVTFTATRGSGKTAEKQIATATFEVMFPTLTLEMAAWDGANATNACKVTGGGKYPFGKKVTLKATPAKESVFVGWYEGEWGTGVGAGARDARPYQAASYPYMTTDEDVTLTAVFATVAEDKDSIALKVDGKEMSSSSDDNPTAAYTNYCGVAVDWPIETEALSATTVKATGLPSGVKLVQDKKTGAYSLVGAPSAASKADKKTGVLKSNLVKLTVTTAGKSSKTYAFNWTILPLPDWVVGTFYGDMMWVTDAFGGSSQYHDIVSTFTVSSAGKLSGKMMVEDDKTKGTTKTVTVTASAIAGMEFASVRMWESDNFVREGEAFYFDTAFTVDKQKYVQRLYLFEAAYSEGVSVGDLLFDRSEGEWIEGHALQNAWGVKDFGGVLPKFGAKGVAVNCSDSKYEYTFTLKNKGSVAVTAKSRTTGKKVAGTGQLRAESYDGGAVRCWTSLKVGNIMMAAGFVIPVDQDGNVAAGGIEILEVDYE